MSFEQPAELSSNSEEIAHPLTPQSPLNFMATRTIMTSPTTAAFAHTTTATSASAPEIHSVRPLATGLMAPSPSLDTGLSQASRNTSSEGLASVLDDTLLGGAQAETDAQILEALRSKDRIYVLKLGEQMENLINDRRTRIELNPATSYQRMLVHRCSSYYRLIPETDQVTKTIYVYYHAESRIPARRMSELVPPEESAQPAFKIMRRTPQDRGKIRQNSEPTSVTGDDADLSDVEASEAGSVGGRSNATGSSKKHRTIEEREAAYNEARSRIFMDYQGKEKDKDMSANSSTFSLVSGSGSASGGRSSIGDVDDSGSSAPTESEWSGPAARDKREGRRGGSAGSSSRSMRSSGASYNANGSGSSRNSRATSPSFTYPSLYEAPHATFDPAYGGQPPPQGYVQYYYPYAPPGQGPGQPYLTAYPYYPSYGYHPAPHQPSPPHHSDPASPAGGDPMYAPQQSAPQQMSYNNPYAWTQPPPAQHPQHLQPPPSNNHTSNHPGPPSQIQHGTAPPPPPHAQSMPPYPAYIPPPYGPYPMPAYYPSPSFQSGQAPPVPHMQSQQYYPHEMTHSADGGLMMHQNGSAPGTEHTNTSRMMSRNNTSPAGATSNGRRMAPKPTRQAWSYGPGAGTGGFSYGNGGGVGNNEIVGPRLSTRRTSGASSGSGGGSTGNRTPGDEASSTSSSTTSSSSRRTFTSTSSKHPLPARPDWAVGLKPQPPLRSPRHHDHSNPNSRNMSPARIGAQQQQQQQQQQHPHHHHPSHHTQPPQPFLQPNDFPPLCASSPEKRPPPVASGAWTNPSTMRSVMTPGAPSGNALVHYPNANSGSPGANGGARLDEQDRAYERPPPKGNAELFNPKSGGAGRRQAVTNGGSPGGGVGVDGYVGAGAGAVDGVSGAGGLAEQMGEMGLGDSGWGYGAGVERKPVASSMPVSPPPESGDVGSA